MRDITEAFAQFASRPLGVVGALAVMAAVTLINSERLKTRYGRRFGVHRVFNGLNLVGAICLCVNAVQQDDLVWIVLEVYLIGIAMKGLLTRPEINAGASVPDASTEAIPVKTPRRNVTSSFAAIALLFAGTSLATFGGLSLLDERVATQQATRTVRPNPAPATSADPLTLSTALQEKPVTSSVLPETPEALLASASAITDRQGAYLDLFDEQVVVLDAHTDPQRGGVVAFSPAEFANEPVAAALIDLDVLGPAGSVVIIHPTHEPTERFDLRIPTSGRLKIPMLPVQPDVRGRVVIASAATVQVRVSALGVYVETAAARGGRYIHTGIAEFGRLVTAVDGHELDVSLASVVVEPRQVSQVLVRMHAKVGPDGATVSAVYAQSAGQDHTVAMWPAPTEPSSGLVATGMALVPVGANGTVRLNYRGGSEMVVDLIGYLTRDAAPRSAIGLFELSPETTQANRISGADNGDVEVALIVVIAGENGGAVTTNGGELLFNLKPGQQEIQPLWTAGGESLALTAPPDADINVWRLGSYRN